MSPFDIVVCADDLLRAISATPQAVKTNEARGSDFVRVLADEPAREGGMRDKTTGLNIGKGPSRGGPDSPRTCPECEGKGIADYDCPHCNGTGEGRHENSRCGWCHHGVVWDTCGRCGGDGCL